MVGCEEHYTPLEKICWAFVWASNKLRHYMLAYPIRLISRMDPLKYLFEKPTLTGKLAPWLLMLAEFELKYVTRKSVKGRVVAEFLADHPVEGGKDAEFKYPDEDLMTITEGIWKLHFDGAANQKGFGIGVLLISPNGSHIPLAFKLNFKVTKNQAKYKACIVGMEAAIEIGVEKLEVVGDSNLVVSQANDALATLASMIKIPIGVKLRPIVIEQRDSPVYQHAMVMMNLTMVSPDIMTFGDL
ncbi:uncharacterized protein LOC131330724 [Rhododendron vialii]|uniref:uncharacterized protein LOC131330724 n=1 Tax=Rhododendron vialii TaxID=182163 RepID=UPI00265EA4A5|nr:uncharacterized protein LOC131330724 [Rhododendron vialii]